jgi:hypothetical protein
MKNIVLLIGIIGGVLLFVPDIGKYIPDLPDNVIASSQDDLDKGNDAYREGLVAVLERVRDEKKTKETLAAINESLASLDQVTVGPPVEHLIGMWQNGEVDAAIEQLKSRRVGIPDE